jgi:hypothetical protein
MPDSDTFSWTQRSVQFGFLRITRQRHMQNGHKIRTHIVAAVLRPICISATQAGLMQHATMPSLLCLPFFFLSGSTDAQITRFLLLVLEPVMHLYNA